MKITFIVLSLCLTLKVTNTKEPTAEISKAYNAFAIVKLADNVLELIDEENDKLLDLIQSFKKQAEFTIFDFSEKDAITNQGSVKKEYKKDVEQFAFEFSEQVHLITFNAMFKNF